MKYKAVNSWSRCFGQVETQPTLADYRLGRIVLHLRVMFRTGHIAFAFAGILREVVR